VSCVGKTVRTWERTHDERGFAAMLAAADQAERDGRFGSALTALDAALRLAEDKSSISQDKINSLRIRRDELSLKDTTNRLAALEAAEDPTRVLGEAITLLKRGGSDVALDPLRDRIRAQVVRGAEAKLARAQRDVADARFDDALEDASTALLAAYPALPPPDGPRLRDEARRLAAELIAERGVALGPITGRFLLGSAASYAADLAPVAAEALKSKGYVVRLANSPFRALWDEATPYRLDLDINETQPGRFGHSLNLYTAIELRPALMKGTKPVYPLNKVLARTRAQPAKLTARQVNVQILTHGRDQQVEQWLYDDARDHLREQLRIRLQSLPSLNPAIAPVAALPGACPLGSPSAATDLTGRASLH
jgi:hypothetical protein